jgi:hypothetical protein
MFTAEEASRATAIMILATIIVTMMMKIRLQGKS